ncbi:MAG TPA: serine hydrolase domain-containing protein [Thermoanaerobaculia bacterium]
MMNQRPVRLAVVVLFLLSSVAGYAAGPSPEAQAMNYLQEIWRSTGAPGISVAVVRQGRLVFSQGVGFADLDNMVPANGSTVYNIGSISKAVATVAVMQLVEQGKVGLDDPIQKYVPTFPDKGSPVTVRHIMTHTSGIRHYRGTDFGGDNENMRPVASLEEGIKVFKDDPLLFKPGEYYSYSSYAVNLLQGVVEKASGQGFEDYMRQHVWSPAGMFSTSFDVPDRIVPHRARGYSNGDGKLSNYGYGDITYKFAGGGMISTVEDLVRLGAALNQGRLLKPETRALMYTPMPPVLQYRGDQAPQKLEFELGLIWRISKDETGRTFIHHCGTVKGFNGCLINYPEQDLVVAILANALPSTPARREAEAFAKLFLAAVEASGDQPSRP